MQLSTNGSYAISEVIEYIEATFLRLSACFLDFRSENKFVKLESVLKVHASYQVDFSNLLLWPYIVFNAEESEIL
jgi:hypothetical protein